jgi:hypothetical protein
MKLSDILKGFDDTTTTTVEENSKTEVSMVDLGYKVRGGGALVLTEVGQLVKGGKDGSAKTDNPAMDKDGKENGGSISDVLGFTDGSKILTFYSDPFKGLNGLDKASLTKQFGPYIAYVEEGTFFDERKVADGGLGTGKITDVSNVTVYIRSAPSFDRAFVLYSDTAGAETPEPTSLALLATASGVLVFCLWRRRRPGMDSAELHPAN